MFTIRLNKESAAVLLRCLAYGENAISQAELDSGAAEVIQSNVADLRRQICRELAEETIIDSAFAEDEPKPVGVTKTPTKQSINEDGSSRKKPRKRT